MRSNRMYVLLIESFSEKEEEKCLHTDVSNKAELWHNRYGHLSFKGLHTLQEKEMVVGLPAFGQEKGVCESCLKGKQHRLPFPKHSSWRADNKLQLVHSDLCGPISPPSNSGKRYLIRFIDDFSRKTWVFFLAEKSETFKYFKVFKAQTKEVSTALRNLENSVTILESSEKGVPKVFWAEAVQWTIHVLNRCPTMAVQNMTPEEAWSGFKPSVDHFRVFGCIGHVHVTDVKRKKLDDKSLKCVLLGYSSESKAYRMYEPISKKIHTSRDVNSESSAEELRFKEVVSEVEGEANHEGSVSENAAQFETMTDQGENDVLSPINNTLRRRRNRNPPAWTSDYVLVKCSTDLDDQVNLSMTDPVVQRTDGIFICQRKYASEVIEKFEMQEFNVVSNPIVPGQNLGKDEADDIIITGNSSQEVDKLITCLSSKFSLKNLGNLNYFLGIEQSEDGIFLNERKYVTYILQKAGMASAKSVSTPMTTSAPPLRNGGELLTSPTDYIQLIGSLQYLGLTQPDVAFIVNKLSQFMQNPRAAHWIALKRLLRYLVGTLDHGIHISATAPLHFHAYSDANWGGDKEYYISTTGYILYLGSSPISWSSKKQKSVAKSSTEAEYKALANTTSEILWVSSLFKELKFTQPDQPVIYCDNMGATSLSSNPVFHSRMKHIALSYHFIREQVQPGNLRAAHVSTNNQLVDVLTKPLLRPQFESIVSKLQLFPPIQ
ncbi:LOW QUALITY PROTEIN: hypothetical protein V2J09_001606 [Rumex salicifolius]